MNKYQIKLTTPTNEEITVDLFQCDECVIDDYLNDELSLKDTVINISSDIFDIVCTNNDEFEEHADIYEKWYDDITPMLKRELKKMKKIYNNPTA